MAILTIPNTFINGTSAVATEVNANFNNVKSFVELLSDGTNIDNGAITYSKLASAVQALFISADSDQIVLGAQVFG